jgi:ferredoxin-NADP reductase
MSRRSTITIDVDIDLDDELDDETLMELARERGLIGSPGSDTGHMGPRELWERLADELRTAAHNGERTHFEVLLHRMVNTAAPRAAIKLNAKTGRLHA